MLFYLIFSHVFCIAGKDLTSKYPYVEYMENKIWWFNKVHGVILHVKSKYIC